MWSKRIRGVRHNQRPKVSNRSYINHHIQGVGESGKPPVLGTGNRVFESRHPDYCVQDEYNMCATCSQLTRVNAHNDAGGRSVSEEPHNLRQIGSTPIPATRRSSSIWQSRCFVITRLEVRFLSSAFRVGSLVEYHVVDVPVPPPFNVIAHLEPGNSGVDREKKVVSRCTTGHT